MVRGPTAYFLFADAVRADVQEELQARQPAGKISVAILGKAIGERWQALSEEEKQVFKDQAAAKAAELAASEDPQGAGDPESSDPSPSTAPASLPTSLVKKIMTMDSDVSRVSAEGLRAVGAATEAFLGLLAAGALARAAGDKRKNFRFGDVLALALKDRRLIDMGLAEVLQQDPQFREACEAVDASAKPKPARAAAVGDIEDVGMRKLTAFFQGPTLVAS